jgi:hypothetical protein
MMVVCSMLTMTAIVQEGGRKAFGADLQVERAVPSRHKAGWNEGTQGIGKHEEACEPLTPA